MTEDFLTFNEIWFALGALFAGFSFTGMLQIITSDTKGWRSSVPSTFFGIATFSFLYAVVVQSLTATTLLQSKISGVEAKDLPTDEFMLFNSAWLFSTGATLIGISAVVIAMGFAGWIYSRSLGIMTSLMASVVLVKIISNLATFLEYF